MGAVRDGFNNTYADGPSGDPSQPLKSEIRDLGGVIEDAIEGAAAGAIQAGTWAALAAIPGTRIGQPGRSTGPDAGTHTDPVVGGTVDNEGEFTWSESPEGWQRIGDIIDGATLQSAIDGKVSKTGNETIAGVKTFSSAPEVPNESFSLAKLANIATDKLIGRDAAGSGAPGEIGLGAGLEMDGSNNLRVKDEGITLAKLQHISSGRVLGRGTSGDGDPVQLTIGSGLLLGTNNQLNTGVNLQALEYRGMPTGIYQLFVPGTVTDDKAVDVDGAVVDFVGRSLSDYIAVIPSAHYSRSVGGTMVGFYDVDKNPIAAAGTTARVFKAPATARYMRASMTTANKASMVIARGTELPLLSANLSYRFAVRDFMPLTEQVWPALFSASGRRLFPEYKVTERNAEFLERDSPNLFDKRTVISGQRENFGSVVTDATNSTSELIPVLPNTVYSVTEGNYVNEYDADKLYVSGHGTGITSFTTGASTYYLRLTVRNVVLDTFMLVQGGTLPGTYQPYHKYNLASSIVVPLPPGVTKRFQDGIWNVLGDSITQEAYAYWSHLIDPLGVATLNNYGVGGTAIAVRAAPWDTNAMCQRYLTMAEPADLITVLGGTNDFITPVPLGTIASSDPTEFYGALNILFEGLVDRYPTSTIAAFTPLPRQTMVNGASTHLLAYADAILEVGEKFFIPVCDLTRGSIFKPFNADNRTALMDDGLHPTELGHEKVALNQMLRFLEAL